MIIDLATAKRPAGDNRLMGALDAADREAVLRVARPTELIHGQVLFEPGDEITHVHFPRSGAVSLIVVMRDGGAVEARMVGREGVTCAYSYAGRHVATCRGVVQLPGEAWRIDAARFREAAESVPQLRGALQAYALRVIADLEQTAACNGAHRLEPRLAKWLLRSHDRADGDVLPLTQEFLAHMLGAQRTTVTEVAKALQAAGAIDYARGRITITNRALLERLSCECYAAMVSREAAAASA